MILVVREFKNEELLCALCASRCDLRGYPPNSPSLIDVKVIEYRLSLRDPHSHLLEVEVRFSCKEGVTELVMPAWTPGSYLIREYARHVQDFVVEGEEGEARRWSKLDKATWRVEGRAGEALRVRYRVYANELTVRTSHFDATHAFVTPAAVFMYVRGRETEGLELQVEAPEGWRVATPLPVAEGEAAGTSQFEAADYDELVDSPLEIGEHRRIEWEQEGKTHDFVVWGRGDVAGERLVRDTRRIIEVVSSMFGGMPYESYLFILHLFPGGRGGLEHRSATALQAERGVFSGDAYERLLALIAHEYFHAWNGKRIHPAGLGPFDYTRENYTRDLWVVEGLTTYYTDLVVRRAGLLSEEKYLARLAEMIERLERMPGRRHQTLAESSFDTWIRFYRPDENSVNSQISYYHKGALVGLLLDLEIRRLTEGARSLDDLMRVLWERYGRVEVGYPEREVERVAEEVAGVELAWFFDAYLRGVEELDYERALAGVGLRLERGIPPRRREGDGTERREGVEAVADAARVEARLGARVREQAGRVQVASVLEGGAGRSAGLDSGDEVVAVGGIRVASVAEMAAALDGVAEGTRVALALFRRDELVQVEVVVGREAERKWRVVPVEGAGAATLELRKGWLGADGGGAPSA